MEENQNKTNKLNLNEIVRIEKRNVFAIAGYHLFSALLGILATLSGYFYLTTSQKTTTIYKWVMLSVVIVAIVLLFVLIRIYKNKNIVELKKRDLFINKIITYIYLIPLIAFIALVMLSKKELQAFFDTKTGAFNNDITGFNKSIIKFQIGQYLSGILLFSLALSLFIYDTILCIKKDTKIPSEEFMKEEELKKEAESMEGELKSEEISDVVDADEVSEVEKENEEKTQSEDIKESKDK